jgi:hypothetical protein
MGATIRKDDPEWERLYKLWSEDPRHPGYVVVGEMTYRVVEVGDGEVVFVPLAPQIELYGSLSTKSIGGHK